MNACMVAIDDMSFQSVGSVGPAEIEGANGVSSSVGKLPGHRVCLSVACNSRCCVCVNYKAWRDHDLDVSAVLVKIVEEAKSCVVHMPYLAWIRRGTIDLCSCRAQYQL